MRPKGLPTVNTTNLSSKVAALYSEIESLDKQGRCVEADLARRSLRDLAGHRTPSGTWRIRCLTVEQQKALSL